MRILNSNKFLFDEDAGPLEDSWTWIAQRVRMPLIVLTVLGGIVFSIGFLPDGAWSKLTGHTTAALNSLLLALDSDYDGAVNDETVDFAGLTIGEADVYYATKTIGGANVLGDVGSGLTPLDLVTSVDSESTDGEIPTAQAVYEAIGSGGGWGGSDCLDDAPGSPTTGEVYCADSDNWNPCTSDAATDYLVFYNGAVYLPLWNIDGTPIVQTAAPGTPKTGWFYWADANGTWDPDTSVSGTDPYQVYYNGSGYISVKKQDGTLLVTTRNITHSTTDGTYTGDIVTMTVDAGASETSFGQAYHIDTDGELIEADADVASAASMPVYCLAVQSGTGSKNCLVRGLITETDWNWTVGGLIYAGDAPGTTEGLTQTAPSTTGDQVQVLGVAITADTIAFTPSMVLVEVP